MTVGGVTTDVFSFDAADQTKSDNSTAFAYDRYGNLTSSSTPAGSMTFGYDLADRLNSITTADAVTIGFTFDAAGRHASRTSTVGGNTTTLDTYAYAGSSGSVILDVSTSGAGYTLVSAIDSAGDRTASSPGAGYGWLVADLHGNVAAQCDAGGTITDAFRYDAYGKGVGTSLTGSIASPWRYQGRILESSGGSGNAEVYDAGARSYVPDLGTFTSLDSVAGSAQNPLSLNRYLYANANPETLTDPDGHATCDPSHWCGSAATNPAVSGWSVTGLTPAPAASVAKTSTKKAATVSRPSSKYGREDSDVGQSAGTWSQSDQQRFVAANTQSSGCSWLGCVAQAAGGLGNAAGSALNTLKAVARPIVDIAAVGPYALYWGSYQTARAVNKFGNQFGLPGQVLSHVLAAPLAIPEGLGLGMDIGLDGYKNLVFGNGEKLNDEGIVGPILPREMHIGPNTYLPGWRQGDGGFDFEW